MGTVVRDDSNPKEIRAWGEPLLGRDLTDAETASWTDRVDQLTAYLIDECEWPSELALEGARFQMARAFFNEVCCAVPPHETDTVDSETLREELRVIANGTPTIRDESTPPPLAIIARRIIAMADRFATVESFGADAERGHALELASSLARESRPLELADALALRRVIPGDPSGNTGYRTHDAKVFLTTLDPQDGQVPHPSAIPALMTVFGDALHRRTSEPPRVPVDAVNLAIWAYLQLVRIHPFSDGNGRTARLLMNVILMRYVTGPGNPLTILRADTESGKPDNHVARVLEMVERGQYERCVEEALLGRRDHFLAFLADCMQSLLGSEREDAAGGYRAVPSGAEQMG